MKLSLRRPAAPADAPDALDDQPAAPRPPRGRPVAVYAAVLDGDHLWLAVEAAPGTLALRDTATGEVLDLPGDHADDPAHRSVRGDLTALPGSGEATYDAVLVPPGGRRAAPVWTPPLPAPGVTVVPVSSDRRHRFGLERADDGTLRVVRRTVEDLPEVVAVTATPTSIELELDVAAGELALVADEDEPALILPVADHRATLHLAGLPAGDERVHRLLLDGRPLRRRGNDLAAPGPAVPLPTLHEPEAERARLRLVWSPRGTLNARFPAAAASGAEA